MQYIVHVVDDQGERKLMVNCWHCNRQPIIGEDDSFCMFCGNEIESTNIAAWEEYERTNPKISLRL